MTNIIKAPTREVELPISKIKVTFKEWLTQDEDDEIREPIRQNEIEISEGKTTQRFNGSVMKKVERLTIEKAVVSISVDGEMIVEGIAGIFGQLPQSDYTFLKKTIDEVLSPPKEKKA